GVARMSYRLLILLTLLSLALAAEAAPLPRRPEVRVGPYRVVVERVTGSQYVQAMFRPEPGGQGAAQTGRRSAHLQLRLLADNPEAAAAVEVLAVHTLTVTANG